MINSEPNPPKEKSSERIIHKRKADPNFPITGPIEEAFIRKSSDTEGDFIKAVLEGDSIKGRLRYGAEKPMK